MLSKPMQKTIKLTSLVSGTLLLSACGVLQIKWMPEKEQTPQMEEIQLGQQQRTHSPQNMVQLTSGGVRAYTNNPTMPFRSGIMKQPETDYVDPVEPEAPTQRIYVAQPQYAPIAQPATPTRQPEVIFRAIVPSYGKPTPYLAQTDPEKKDEKKEREDDNR